MPHVIRLRSAWRSDGSTHSRRFHRPTGVDGGERLFLAVGERRGVSAVRLNDRPVRLGADGRAEVTDLLSPTNTLVVEAADAALLASVRLEIEAPSAGDGVADRQQAAE